VLNMTTVTIFLRIFLRYMYIISVAHIFDDFRYDYAFLLKMSENQDEFLKSIFFDLQKSVIQGLL
jgi:hypothetical protein